MPKKPNLTIIAGPNGSGKTTITHLFLKHQWADDTVYVNPDEIAQEKFGGWNNKASFIKAANYAEELRQNCIKNKQNLVFETVFSTQGKVDFIQQAIDAGFFVRLFFIATDDPTINAKRITLRVMEGGHSVPIDKIISRYYKSIKNCGKIINLVNRAYIYNNSTDNIEPKLCFRVENNANNQVVKTYEPLLGWTKSIYDVVNFKK